MSIIITPVKTDKQLKQFIRYNYELYKENPYFVPDLYEDMKKTLSSKSNAAFEFCESEYFLALDGERIVGRIAAIINHKSNETWNQKCVRFGWIDFVDDTVVSKLLLEKVEKWGIERGMTQIHGPLGFTDFDAEGMLVEGFDKLGTMATIYNYPYYPVHMEKHGYSKDVDWVEFLIKIPTENFEKTERLSALVSQRFGLKVKKCKSRKELANQYGQVIFDLMNESYAPLYGFSALTPNQIKQYVKMYLPIIDLRLITLVVDKDEKLVAAGITMASLAEALRKAKGKLFPFGWYHLLKALFLSPPTRVDFLLIAVKPEYQNKGVNAMIINDMLPSYIKQGFKDVETNPELEENEKVQAQWSYFDKEQHKRRRSFKKTLKNI